jgi:hypothetical protein
VENFALNIHKPTAGFTITQFENVAMFEDTSRKANNWVWDFGDGTFSKEQNPIHEYDQPGVFTVIQFASNDLISWDTASGLAYSFVGINETRNQTLKIYPNPVTDFLNIQNKSNGKMKVVIADISGKILYSFPLDSGTTKKFSMSHFEKGIYLLRFRSEAVMVSKKVIKI